MSIDLHIHTTASDGAWSPQDILNHPGLTVISFADHNTNEGYQTELHVPHGVTLIRGIELSAYEPGTQRARHLLGYGYDQNKMTKMLHENYNRAQALDLTRLYVAELCQKCQQFGLVVSHVPMVNRPYCVSAAVWGEITQHPENDWFVNENTVYSFGWDHLSAPWSPLYVNTSELYKSIPDAIQLLHDTGALVFAAHPSCHYPLLRDALHYCESCKQYGVDGIEAFHADHTLEQRLTLCNWAKTNGLYVSGGSDFHKEGLPGIGVPTAELVDDWLPAMVERSAL